MHIINNTALISINETMLVQLVSFLIFMVIINRVMFKPLRRTMMERDHYVDSLRQEIGDAEDELRRETAEMEKRKEAVRAEALAMTRALEEEGGRDAARILNSAREEIVRMKEKTSAEVAVQIAEAKKRLESEVGVIVVQIMEKVLERRL